MLRLLAILENVVVGELTTARWPETGHFIDATDHPEWQIGWRLVDGDMLPPLPVEPVPQEDSICVDTNNRVRAIEIELKEVKALLEQLCQTKNSS